MSYIELGKPRTARSRPSRSRSFRSGTSRWDPVSRTYIRSWNPASRSRPDVENQLQAVFPVRGKSCCKPWVIALSVVGSILIIVLIILILWLSGVIFAPKENNDYIESTEQTTGSSHNVWVPLCNVRRPERPSKTTNVSPERKPVKVTTSSGWFSNLTKPKVSSAGAPFPTCPTNPAGYCEYRKTDRECKCIQPFYWNTKDGKGRAGYTGYIGAHNPKGWVKGSSVRWRKATPIVRENGYIKVMGSQSDTTIVQEWGPTETPSWWGTY